MSAALNVPATHRTNTLALIFQEILTVILRIRFPKQSVSDVASFRAHIRTSIANTAQNARNIGYSDETSQMAIYAAIAFLDESVLVSRDPAFADWSRRPLQDEIFGRNDAGEYFFRHLQELLNRPESPEVADILELHALCLLLGYRGRYALGESGELHSLVSRIREKILRIRGPMSLTENVQFSEIRLTPNPDSWITRLLIAAIVLAVLGVGGYFGFQLSLSSIRNQIAVAASNTR